MTSIVNDYYASFYAQVHGRSITGNANARLQRDLERPHLGKHYTRVLELGAGQLTHISHVHHGYDVYVAADIRTPTTLGAWQLVTTGSIPAAPGNYFAELDAQTLDYPDESFDRLLTTCLLMHLDDPLEAIHGWRRVVRPGGVLDVLVPCDPGLVVRAYRSAFSRRRARALGFEHFDLVNALDHKRPVGSLLTIAKYAFRDDDLKVDWYPFARVPSWNLNSHLVLRVQRN